MFWEKLADTMMCLYQYYRCASTRGGRHRTPPKIVPYSLPSAVQHKGEPPRQAHGCQMPGYKKKSIFYCVECNKCLCIKGHSMCFSKYHEQLKHLEVQQPPQQLQKRGDGEKIASSSASPSDSNDDAPAPPTQRVFNT